MRLKITTVYYSYFSEGVRYRVTDKQTNRQTDPTTVPSLRMRAEGNYLKSSIAARARL